jgi:hypothetical protein
MRSIPDIDDDVLRAAEELVRCRRTTAGAVIAEFVGRVPMRGLP